MEEIKRTILYKGKEYPCLVTIKPMRGMSFRLSRDRTSLLVSASTTLSLRTIDQEIKKHFPKLMEKVKDRIPPIDGDYVYIFGNKEKIEGFSTLDPKAKEKILKSYLLPYVSKRSKELAFKMRIKPYEIKIRTMVSRYGVNSSKFHRITYATMLVHYSKEIIDSVIIHELAHDKERNHQKGFYDIVYKYSPNYQSLSQKLKKGIYQ